MAKPIRCALAGTGHAHATGKLTVLKQSEDWELVGVYEPDDSWREKSEQNPAFDDVRWLTEDETFGDDSIRMICVESEVQQLLGLGRKAIDVGKHLHLDKPAGESLSEFKEILDDAEDKNLIVQMGYMFRYNSGFDLIRQAMGEGWLGDVHYVHGSINSDINAESRKRLSFHPGGMIFELACHLIDMVVLLMGRPEKVTPILRRDGRFDDDFNDNNVAILEYDRAVAVVETSALEVGASQRRQFEVCGSGGSVILQPLEPSENVRLFLKEPHGGYEAGWQTIQRKFVPRYIGDVDEFARCINGQQEFPYSKEHDYHVQETVLRASGVSGEG